jgi:hypothetical protein
MWAGGSPGGAPKVISPVSNELNQRFASVSFLRHRRWNSRLVMGTSPPLSYRKQSLNSITQLRKDRISSRSPTRGAPFAATRGGWFEKR